MPSGWNVGIHRNKEFARWVSTFNEDKGGSASSRYGNLRMKPDGTVYSYALCIAKIFPQQRVVTYLADVRRSRTTSMHLKAVTGAWYLLPDWTFLPCSSLAFQCKKLEDVISLLWDQDVKEKDVPRVLHYKNTLQRKLGLGNADEQVTKSMKEFVKLPKIKQLSAQAIVELQLDTQL